MISDEQRMQAGRELARQQPQRGRRHVALLAVVFALAGCAGSSAPKPTKVEGTIEAAVGLNPSVSERPSPLILRIYDLRSTTTFNQADFMALYQSDQAALASDLVAREEIMLQPGEKRRFARQLAPDTRFIGVIGVYRNLERATWRAVVMIKPGQTQTINFRADALALSATVLP